MRLVPITSVDQLKTGLRVRCTMYQAIVKDAKWFIRGHEAFLCSNEPALDGAPCGEENRQGYLYSYVFILQEITRLGSRNSGILGLRAMLKEGETL